MTGSSRRGFAVSFRLGPVALAAAVVAAMTIGGGSSGPAGVWAETPAEELAVVEAAIRATVKITDGKTSSTGFLVALSPEAGEAVERAGGDDDGNEDVGSEAAARAKVEGDAATEPDADEPANRRLALVTAGHTFRNLKAPNCRVVFRALEPDGNFARREVELTLRDGDETLWTTHPDQDVAAIAIEPPKDAQYAAFERSHFADAQDFETKRAHVAQEVYIPCYPAQLESHRAGFPALRRGTVASYPLRFDRPDDTLLIDYSNFGGDSGAPVFAVVEGRALILGVAFASVRQTDKVSTPFEDRTSHFPLGLSRVAPAPAVQEVLAALREKSLPAEASAR